MFENKSKTENYSIVDISGEFIAKNCALYVNKNRFILKDDYHCYEFSEAIRSFNVISDKTSTLMQDRNYGDVYIYGDNEFCKYKIRMNETPYKFSNVIKYIPNSIETHENHENHEIMYCGYHYVFLEDGTVIRSDGIYIPRAKSLLNESTEVVKQHLDKFGIRMDRSTELYSVEMEILELTPKI